MYYQSFPLFNITSLIITYFWVNRVFVTYITGNTLDNNQLHFD